jgi:hypothetical protein
MVVHQAIDVAEPVVPDCNTVKDIEECLTVMVIMKYCFTLIAPTGDMVYGSGKFYA